MWTTTPGRTASMIGTDHSLATVSPSEAAASTYSPFSPGFDFNLRALARPEPDSADEILAQAMRYQLSDYAESNDDRSSGPSEEDEEEEDEYDDEDIEEEEEARWRHPALQHEHPERHYTARTDHHMYPQFYPHQHAHDLQRWYWLTAASNWSNTNTPNTHIHKHPHNMNTTSLSPRSRFFKSHYARETGVQTVTPPPISPAITPRSSPSRGRFPPSKRFASPASTSSPSALLPMCRLTQMDVGDRIDPNMISFGEVIGEGSFGAVYKGHYTGQDVAIKRLKLSSQLKPEELSRAIRKFENEVKILKTLRHPNVVTYLGIVPFPDDDDLDDLEDDLDLDDEEVPQHDHNNSTSTDQLLSYCIVTELCPNGTLMDFLRKKKRLSWTRYLQIAKDIVSGLSFLHAKHIIHRDLKPGNVLMTESGKAKLADFGLAHVKESGENTVRPYGVCGTKCYVAPEVLRNEPYGVAADVFSLGVVLCQMITGSYPFDTFSDNSSASAVSVSGALAENISYESRILAGDRPRIPPHTLPDLRVLIEACWSADPDRRPPIPHVMKWLDSISRSLNIRLQSAVDDLLDEVPSRSRRYFEEMQARMTDMSSEMESCKTRVTELQLRLEQSEKHRKVQLACVQLRYQRLLHEKEQQNAELMSDVSRLTLALQRVHAGAAAQRPHLGHPAQHGSDSETEETAVETHHPTKLMQQGRGRSRTTSKRRWG